jgi:hypothetical protein
MGSSDFYRRAEFESYMLPGSAPDPAREDEQQRILPVFRKSILKHDFMLLKEVIT